MELRLGYEFNHPHLLEQALTHRSLSTAHYERLEFLGDSILGAVIARILFERDPVAQEGNLTKTRSGIVNEKTLAEIAVSLELHRHIKVGRSGEKDQLYTNPSVLADVLEAIIGAIYVDGGFVHAEQFVMRTFEKAINSPSSFRDFKSELQIKVQRAFKVQPVYKVIKAIGPEHRKTFTVGVYVKDMKVAQEDGPSKKEAEQNAAKLALFSSMI